MTDSIQAALSYISSEPREDWIRVGMALKHELGDAGFSVWNAWSQTSPNYNEKVAVQQWRTFKIGASKTITIGSLYWLARQRGWAPDKPIQRSCPAYDRSAIERAEREAAAEALRAAERAKTWLARAVYQEHPYLAAKGFSEAKALVLKERLLVPMRDRRSRDVVAVQTIDPGGAKKFLPWRCQVSGAAHIMGGRRGQVWYVEGYATGLTLIAVLREHLYRPEDAVWCCFSASNMAKIALELGGRGLVVADHDPLKKNGSIGDGISYARRTNLPFYLPPESMDLNDMQRAYGLAHVADEIRQFLYSQSS